MTAYVTILLGLVVILGILAAAIIEVLVKLYFVDGREFEDEQFKWKYRYEFVFGKGGVYGLRKVYIFMGTK